jgi:hypothetical protein
MKITTISAEVGSAQAAFQALRATLDAETLADQRVAAALARLAAALESAYERSVLRRSSIRASCRSGRAGRRCSPACCELEDE